jgi:cystathionine beta-lyase
LIWRELEYDNESRIKLLEETAKVVLDHGNWFGDNGNGFERINLACPRTILEKAVESIIKALK